jgi:glycosyltransferase involved in cell wall biosynthesis
MGLVSRQLRICVVIPTKNEASTICDVIREVKVEVQSLGHQVAAVLIADDSKDETRSIAREAGAEVVIGGGKGLGHAMLRGLKASLQYETDAIVALDGDGQSDISELHTFLAPIVSGEADLVLGSRFLNKGLIKYRYRFKNRFGVLILVRILRWLTKRELTDSHGGLRAMTPDVVSELEMIGTHTYVQETIIDAVEKGFQVKEVPSVWRARSEGKSRVVSSIPIYVFHTLPVLLLRSGVHIHYLYSLGLIFLVLSCVDFAIVAMQTGLSLKTMFDRQSFHLIVLLFSLGLQCFFTGFVLELIGGLKRSIGQPMGSFRREQTLVEES